MSLRKEQLSQLPLYTWRRAIHALQQLSEARQHRWLLTRRHHLHFHLPVVSLPPHHQQPHALSWWYQGESINEGHSKIIRGCSGTIPVSTTPMFHSNSLDFFSLIRRDDWRGYHDIHGWFIRLFNDFKLFHFLPDRFVCQQGHQHVFSRLHWGTIRKCSLFSKISILFCCSHVIKFNCYCL